MAKKKIEKKEVMVFCRECSNFERDVDGISRNVETGEYFMGRCPYKETKVFANITLTCKKYSKK